MAEETDQLRFAAIMTSNNQQCHCQKKKTGYVYKPMVVICGEQDCQLLEPRRYTRVGRGETSKYQDFVQNIGASATYA
jgi:hypothetical protein